MRSRFATALVVLVVMVMAPLAVDAQPAAKIYRIGLLGGSPPTARDASARLWEDFFQEMRDLGNVEGRNLVVEGRWYGERTERLPTLAAELVRLKVDVIIAGAAPAPEAAHRATSTILSSWRVMSIRWGAGSR